MACIPFFGIFLIADPGSNIVYIIQQKNQIKLI